MRSAILMSSVAVAALATPALAAPDRYDQGYSCSGMGPQCVQQEMRLEDGNRKDEKANGVGDFSGAAFNASRADTDDDDQVGDEVGDEISNAADEAGDEISEAADEVGDEIGEAADEVGDEIGDAFD